MRIGRHLPTAVGLLVAFGGPALLGPLQRLLGDRSALSRRLLGQAAMWGLLVTIIALVVLWEHRALSSIGWRGLRLSSLAWGLV